MPALAPSAAKSGMAPVVINLPGVGQATAMMALGDRDDFTTRLKREALKRGGRR